MSKEMLKKAIEEQLNGNLYSAEELYKKILKNGENNATAMGNLGNIYMQQGKPKKALKFTLKAVNLEPEDPTFLMNAGAIYKDLREYDLARELTLKSLDIFPNNPIALTNLGGIERETGNAKDALELTQKSLSINQNLPASHQCLGAIYKDAGKTENAYKAFLRCLQLDPNNPRAMADLALVLRDLGQPEKAEQLILNSLKVMPEETKFLNQLSLIQMELGKKDEASENTKKSVEIDSNNSLSWQLLGESLLENFRPKEALNAIHKSLQLNPEEPATYCTLGRIYNALGKLEKAEKLFNLSLKNNPNLAEAAFQLSLNLNSNAQTRELLQKINKIESKKLSRLQIASIKLATSNCFHKLKNYSQSQLFLSEANAIRYSMRASECPGLIQEINHLSGAKNPPLINKKEAKYKKIFIIGMPRSGSTLLENILIRNQSIATIGESDALAKSLTEILTTSGSAADYSTIDQMYEERTHSKADKSDYLVDKQLYNFRYTGIIATNISSSKLIHTRRHPLDNILSIYRAGLKTTYTSNLAEIAKVLVCQEQAMLKYKMDWPTRIFTFQYDNFVQDPKPNLLKLLQWLDLPWTDDYLRLHGNDSPVFTASVVQVRKPISPKSSGGWKNYAEMLKTAREIIKESNLFKDFDLDD